MTCTQDRCRRSPAGERAGWVFAIIAWAGVVLGAAAVAFF